VKKLKLSPTLIDEAFQALKQTARETRDRPAQERVDALNQIMGSYLEQAGRLPPDLKKQLKKMQQ
jgi:hypothetical protein